MKYFYLHSMSTTIVSEFKTIAEVWSLIFRIACYLQVWMMRMKAGGT